MNIAVLDNGIGYLAETYNADNFAGHSFTIIPALALGESDISGYDIFIAPNGTDHVALYRNRDKISDFLAGGGAVLCFCGWTTDWIPGSTWEMQYNIPLRTYEITFPDPEHPLLRGIRIDEVNINNGKRGFWVCGHINSAQDAEVLMVNNLNEPVMILDEHTTNGTIVATASGPLPTFEEHPGEERHSFDILFQNILERCEARAEKRQPAGAT